MGIDHDGARRIAAGVIHFGPGIRAKEMQGFHRRDQVFAILHGLIFCGHLCGQRHGIAARRIGTGGKAQKGDKGGQLGQDGWHGGALGLRKGRAKKRLGIKTRQPLAR